MAKKILGNSNRHPVLQNSLKIRQIQPESDRITQNHVHFWMTIDRLFTGGISRGHVGLSRVPK